MKSTSSELRMLAAVAAAHEKTPDRLHAGAQRGAGGLYIVCRAGRRERQHGFAGGQKD